MNYILSTIIRVPCEKEKRREMAQAWPRAKSASIKIFEVNLNKTKSHFTFVNSKFDIKRILCANLLKIPYKLNYKPLIMADKAASL